MSLHSDFGIAKLGSGELISNKVSKLTYYYGDQAKIFHSVNQKIQKEMIKRCHQIVSDITEKRETFLRNRIKPFWVTPQGIKFAKNFLTLKIFSRTVETGPNQFCFVEELSIECKPAIFGKIFLKTEKEKKL